VFAAAARAPITALLIIFELTGNYQIILPLMFAIVVATALANHITADNIYTLKLRRRGIDLDAEAPLARVMTQITVGQAMNQPPDPESPAGSPSWTGQPLHAGDSLEEAIEALAATDDGGLPVLSDDDTQTVGWLTHRQVLEAYRARIATDGAASDSGSEAVLDSVSDVISDSASVRDGPKPRGAPKYGAQSESSA
jgi:CIC family chloride channel protein